MTFPLVRVRRRSVMRIGAGLVLLLCLFWAPGQAQERDFVPVTDAMLQEPDPADWLNWRRTLDGWGYSPLDQIDRSNVHELQLVWAWPLGRGLSQPTPLVYDGVMYIPSPRNVVQAVDAVTGDRIWEYARDFEAAEALDAVGAGMRTRSIALYGDKIYVNTSDAHIVALDARSGEVAWDHTVADYRLGYRYTSGPHRRRGPHRGRHDRLPELQERRLLHLRPRPGFGRGGLAHLDHRAARRAGRRHLGRPAADLPGRGRLLDSGQLRPGDQPHVLVDVPGEALGSRVA